MQPFEQWQPELDALIAAPKHHTLLFENESVRVLDTKIGPGDRTPLHTHQWPSVLHIQCVSPFVRRDASGSIVLDTRNSPLPASLPVTVWSQPLPAHSLENVGETEIHVISVEIKKSTI